MFLITQEDKYVIATDITTGVTSQGFNEDEAHKNLREALELYYEEDNEETDMRYATKPQRCVKGSISQKS